MMKIWGDIPKVSGVYGSTPRIDRAWRAGEVASRRDELTISGIAKDFTVAMKALKKVPDIRQDRVNEILQKMGNNEYSVSAEDVAKKIVG